MSDEEEYTDEEVDEEEVEESEAAPEPEKPAEEPAAEEEDVEVETEEPSESTPAAPAAPADDGVEAAPKLRKVERPAKSEGEQGKELSEAEEAMLAAKKKHEEEEAARLKTYEENRHLEKIKVDEELQALKQRQVERRKEWEAEERQYAEQRRADEERKRQEIEERKAKIENAKAKREEEKTRRQLLMTGAFVGGGATGDKPGRNFTVVKKEGGQAAGGPTESASKRKGKSAEELAAEKSNYMSIVTRSVDVSNLLPNDLKNKIKQLHAKIVRLESEKYDLQKRHERQDYDLKELAERESQRARNKALAMGVEIEQAESGLVRPPKINVASKFDRQVDRRTYKEKYTQFESPYVKPNPSIARGTARPPPEWGRKVNDELDQIRKNLGAPKYVEQVHIEGARAPVEPKPLQLPAGDFEEDPNAAPAPVQEEAPAPPEKPKRGVRA